MSWLKFSAKPSTVSTALSVSPLMVIVTGFSLTVLRVSFTPSITSSSSLVELVISRPPPSSVAPKRILASWAGWMVEVRVRTVKESSSNTRPGPKAMASPESKGAGEPIW